MRLDLAGSRWAGVYWDDGGLLGALQATLPNATLPCDDLPFTREADVVAEGLALEKGHFYRADRVGVGD